jgi:preprotein translocase subunit SecD
MKFLGMLALFTTSLVAGELLEVAEVSKEAVPGSREVTHVYGEHSEVLHLHAPPLLVSKDVAKVSIGDEPRSVTVVLTAEAAKKFAKDTAGMEGKRFAVLVQGKVMSVPMVRTAPWGGTFIISGFKDEAEVKGFVEAFAKGKE